MLDLETIRKLLKDRRIDVVATETGLHVNTISKVKAENSNPTYKTLKAVSDYLEAQAGFYQP